MRSCHCYTPAVEYPTQIGSFRQSANNMSPLHIKNEQVDKTPPKVRELWDETPLEKPKTICTVDCGTSPVCRTLSYLPYNAHARL